MNDDYLRVVNASSFEWIAAAQRDEAKHKVVPADAIVIERGEPMAPWISEEHAQGFVASATGYVSTKPNFTADLLAHARAHAVLLIEAVEYLDAHPPVDEEQVEALTDALSSDMGMRAEDIARRLVEQGWTKGGPR
jgi:hypothetical protein